MIKVQGPILYVHSFSFCTAETQVKLLEAPIGEESENIRGAQRHMSQEVSSLNRLISKSSSFMIFTL